MFATLGRLVVQHPWKVVAAWVVGAVALISLSPPLSDVVEADQASFLPASYESVQAEELARAAFAQHAGATAAAVVTRADGQPLRPEDSARVQRLAAELAGAGIGRVAAVVTGPQAVSPNRKVQLVSITFTGSAQDRAVQDALVALRERTAGALAGSGLRAAFTGDVAVLVDNLDAFREAERIVGFVTILLIVVLQLAIFRSPLAALLPLLAVGLVFALSQSLIALAGKAFGFSVGQELPTLLTVVLFGIGTDYVLFLLFRYRERLRAGDAGRAAVARAVERAGEVIASAAAAVVVAFSALLLASLGFFRTLGPGLAISVLVMLVAAVTLVPAILALAGPRVFWPSKSWQAPPRAPLARRLGQAVARRAGAVAGATGLLLAALASGVAGFNASYDTLSQLPEGTESARALKDLQAGFPAGALNPTTVYLRGGAPLDQAAVQAFAARLAGAEGVGQVQPPQLGQDGRVARVNLLLAVEPFSGEALDAIEPLREAARAAAPAGTEVLVGGSTASLADLRQASERDVRVVFPVAGAAILLILVLLLRSLLAPAYLMVAVMLGVAASLGASVYVVQGLQGEPGVVFMLPILLYLFVVAIGTDYNILMVARLREEASAGHGPRAAAALAIEHAGPSAAAAAAILAGTFASLLLAGVALLTQTGFAVTAGILLSAFVVSILLVPALTALAGRAAWWPGRLARPGGAPAGPPERPLEATRAD